jgi:hypothetical protein
MLSAFVGMGLHEKLSLSLSREAGDDCDEQGWSEISNPAVEFRRNAYKDFGPIETHKIEEDGPRPDSKQGSVHMACLLYNVCLLPVTILKFRAQGNPRRISC